MVDVISLMDAAFWLGVTYSNIWQGNPSTAVKLFALHNLVSKKNMQFLNNIDPMHIFLKIQKPNLLCLWLQSYTPWACKTYHFRAKLLQMLMDATFVYLMSD